MRQDDLFIYTNAAVLYAVVFFIMKSIIPLILKKNNAKKTNLIVKPIYIIMPYEQERKFL